MTIKEMQSKVLNLQNETKKLNDAYWKWALKDFLPNFIIGSLLFSFFFWSFTEFYKHFGFERLMILFMTVVVVNAVRPKKASN